MVPRLKQPCGGCGKNKQAKLAVQTLNTFLDAAEMNLQGAWLTDIPLEYRGAISKLIEAIQALKTPQGPPPLETQLAGLVNITNRIGWNIPCGSCRRAWYEGVVRSVQVRLLLEQGHPWRAAWLYLESDLKEKWWLFRALLSKF